MGFLDRLIPRRRQAEVSPSTDESFEQLEWLEPEANPFGVRVLDCRPIAETFLSASEDARSIRFFGTPAAVSGDRFRGEHPEEAIRVSCELVYPLEEALPKGPIFLASSMEEKWNIYHFDGMLYFARSWTGQLCYVARLADSRSEIRVVEVEAWPGNVLGDDGLAVRQVDYLIKSHVFNQVSPHPVPLLAEKKAVALWSFSQYGRRGLFAAVEGGTPPQTSSAPDDQGE